MSKIEIQCNNNQKCTKDIERLVKDELKANDIHLNSVEDLNIYYKPEFNQVYYVATTKNGRIYHNIEPLIIA
jgi:hypothetical protein